TAADYMIGDWDVRKSGMSVGVLREIGLPAAAALPVLNSYTNHPRLLASSQGGLRSRSKHSPFLGCDRCEEWCQLAAKQVYFSTGLIASVQGVTTFTALPSARLCGGSMMTCSPAAT